MKNITYIKIGLISMVVLMVFSCGTGKKQTVLKSNTPVLYNPATSSLHPDLGIYHVSDIESQLYIVINANELLVNEANTGGVPRASLRIHFELYDCTEIENNKIVSDSSTFVNTIEIKQQQRTVVFPISFAADQGRRYLLLVQITDLLRRNTIKQFVIVDKTDIFSAQNFKLTLLNGAPHIGNVINEMTIFRIVYQRRHIDSLYIRYMAKPQPLATSPLAQAPAPELRFKADSTWVQPYSPNTNLMFGYEGIYYIQSDTLQPSGLLILNFGTTFPREDRTAQLVQPIQYLTTATEYLKLSEAASAKQMMDNFWLATTGSTDKARMLIRVFYTRMAYANRYFTDYKEGWKTDRGMIYMIYGLPNNILKGSNSETWEYTRKQTASPLSFVFDYKASPYSNSHYVLRRGGPDPTYWRQAVDAWRKGKVFTLDDLE